MIEIYITFTLMIYIIAWNAKAQEQGNNAVSQKDEYLKIHSKYQLKTRSFLKAVLNYKLS